MPKQKTDIIRVLPAGMPTSRQENIYINMFPEVVENTLTQSKRVYCVKRKGLSETYVDVSASASGEARGIFHWPALDYIYVVYGSTVWEYTGSVLTSRITLSTSTGTVGFTECVYGLKKYLFVADGSKGYLIDKDTPTTVTTIDNTIVENVVITAAGTGYTTPPTVTVSGGGGSGLAITATVSGGQVVSLTITNKGSGYTSAPTLGFTGGGGSGASASAFLSAFPVPHIPQPMFMDGYVFLAKSGTSEVYNSLLGEFDAFEDGQFILAAQFPGDIKALTKQQNYIMAMKDDSVEYLYNAANASGSPLSRSQQAITQLGCNQRSTVETLEDDVIFVGKGAGGGFGVWRINGFKETKVSTEYIDKYLNEELGLYGNTSLSADYLVGAVVRLDGHSFYIISERVNTLNKRAVVYDPQEKFWSFWDSQSSLVGNSEFIGKYATTRFDKSYFQTTAEKVMRFPQSSASGSYNDNGSIFYAYYNTPVIDMDNNYRKRWRSLDLIGDQYSFDNTVYINYYDKTTLVQPGWNINRNTNECRNLHNLGMSKARIWQVYHDTDKPFKFENIEIFYVQGVN